MLSYFQQLEAGLQARLAEQRAVGGERAGEEGGEADGSIVARKRFALESARLGVKLYTPGERVAWCGLMVPFDLLNAMGVNSCFVEFVGAMLASSGTVEPILQQAEQGGFATDSCSYHRAVCGAAAQGLMPVPDFLVATSCPCSGGQAVIEHLARLYDKPLFAIHVPQRQDERAVAYLADQYRAMAAFVSEHSGQQLDMARLARAVELTNQARELWVQVNQLAAAVPTPARRRDLVNLGVVISLYMGSETGVSLARCYRDEFARKLAAGQAGSAHEKLRLLWLQNRIQFKTPLELMLEEELGAVVVADELNEITWQPIDPDDPFPGFARRTLSVPLGRGVEQRIAHLRGMARKYGVHGAVNPCHWGCRQGSGARGLLERALKKEGVPVLNLEVDCVDPRQFAPGQLRTRMEAFVEMLQQARAS